MWSFKHLLLMV